MKDLSSEQEAQQTRIALQLGFANLYKNLTDYLQRLNISATIKSFSMMNLDQGAMWVREGIAAMQFNFQEKPSEVPQEDKLEDEVKKEPKTSKKKSAA